MSYWVFNEDQLNEASKNYVSQQLKDDVDDQTGVLVTEALCGVIKRFLYSDQAKQAGIIKNAETTDEAAGD